MAPRSLQRLLCCLSLAVPGTVVAALLDVDFGLTYEDNVAQAERQADRLADERVTLGAALRHTVHLAPSLNVGLEASLAATDSLRFQALDALAAGAAARWRFQPLRRFAAPWLELDLEARYRRHRDSVLRDGADGLARLALAKRLGDRLLGRLGYAFDLRRARRERVFDLEGHRLFVNLDYAVTPRLALYTTGTWRSGEIVSSSAAWPTLLRHANAFASDPALRHEPRRLPPGVPVPAGGPPVVPRVAYQLEASAFDALAGANLALGAHASLDVHAGYLNTRGRGNNDYRGFRAGVQLLYRFELP